MQTKINFTSGWSSAVYAERNRIVFENKNRSYGAFVIRTSYERNLILALLLAFIFFTGLLTLPGILSRPIDLVATLVKKDTIPLTVFHHDIVVKKELKIIPTVTHPAFHKSFNNKNFTPVVMNDKDTMEDKKDDHANDHSNDNNTKGNDSSDRKMDVGFEDKHEVKPNNTPVKFASVMPSFPGGDDAMRDYLGHELHFPEFCIRNGVEGTVFLTFIVNRDGSIGDIEVLRGVDKFLNEEAIRVVKKMPKWTPGMQNEEPVRVQLNLPVKFKIKDR